MNRLSHFERSFQDTERLWIPSPFRARNRWRSLGYAIQGLRDAWETQVNLRLHVYAGIGAVAFGMSLRLSVIEWLWISFAIGLVIFAELMNTAIEQMVDVIVGSRLDPFARRVKDLAAGCVLVAAVIAGIIGALTFGPHLFIG